MAVKLSPLAGAGWQFFDNLGTPLAGGLLYTYTAGTTTPQATYTSAAGTIANSNPIVLDAAGRTANQTWLTTGGAYKFVLQTSAAVTIGTYDNISGINDLTGSTGSTSITTLGTITTGTWNATPIGIAYGGTGLTSIPARSVPVANVANTYTTVTPAALQSIRINAGNTAWEAYTPSSGTPTPDVQTFNSTATWTKPTVGHTMAIIQVWGGGGGGGSSTSTLATGGGGGGYNELTVPLSYLASSLTVTVGAGGTGATVAGLGSAGGNSSVPLATSVNSRSTIDAGGGGPGSDNAQGGGGGGQLSGGVSATPGAPRINVGGNAMGFGSNFTALSGIWTGGGGSRDGSAGNSVWGGGGGIQTGLIAGISLWGGNGGVDAAGTAPGGGGGASSSANTNGSAGAAGRVIITCW